MDNEDELLALYLHEVERLSDIYPHLPLLANGILAAVTLSIACNSRSFSRIFNVEHALVLREVQQLAQDDYIRITRRNERSQRCHYVLTAEVL